MMAPGEGRRFAAQRRVRLGDVRPTGRARLDAVARWLQDVAADDVSDAGVEDQVAWVVRRTSLLIHARPRYGEPVELATWCSGSGHAWAERRTTVARAGAPAIEAVALWVALDRRTQRPVALADHFFEIWGEQSRRPVRPRLVHPKAPAGAGQERRFELRVADFDVLGHVNNAVAWAAVEEQLEAGDRVAYAEVEYREAIEPGASVRLQTVRENASLACWLLDSQDSALASARVRLSPTPREATERFEATVGG